LYFLRTHLKQPVFYEEKKPSLDADKVKELLDSGVVGYAIEKELGIGD
tara:strand:- start:154 stop:297 length:144 start_codon:yes stop_codon:yes gene_type:complete